MERVRSAVAPAGDACFRLGAEEGEAELVAVAVLQRDLEHRRRYERLLQKRDGERTNRLGEGALPSLERALARRVEELATRRVTHESALNAQAAAHAEEILVARKVSFFLFTVTFHANHAHN